MRETLTTTELLQALDWQPGCQNPKGAAGHGPASHVMVMITCPCLILLCEACAALVNRYAAKQERPIHNWCNICHDIAFGWRRDMYRIEPLP